MNIIQLDERGFFRHDDENCTLRIGDHVPITYTGFYRVDDVGSGLAYYSFGIMLPEELAVHLACRTIAEFITYSHSICFYLREHLMIDKLQVLRRSPLSIAGIQIETYDALDTV
jgi:hypothetical protein